MEAKLCYQGQEDKLAAREKQGLVSLIQLDRSKVQRGSFRHSLPDCGQLTIELER